MKIPCCILQVEATSTESTQLDRYSALGQTNPMAKLRGLSNGSFIKS